MSTVSLSIDGVRLEADADKSILWAALDNGIYIPHLCAIRDTEEPFGACRLCFVEIAGRPQPVAACAEPVSGGMVVSTNGAHARRLARTALELLLASHPVDCGHCGASGSCGLQTAAKHLGVKLNTRRFKKLLRDLPIDRSSPIFTHDPNKCVLCGRCVWRCRKCEKGTIGFAHRGFDRVVTSFGDRPIGEATCGGCRELAAVCPVGAFTDKVSPSAVSNQPATPPDNIC